MSVNEDDARQREGWLIEIHDLKLALEAARKEIALDDEIIAGRTSVLDALPCPVHGPCVPRALEQIEKFKTLRDRIIALIYEELSHEYMPLVNRLVEKIRELP